MRRVDLQRNHTVADARTGDRESTLPKNAPIETNAQSRTYPDSDQRDAAFRRAQGIRPACSPTSADDLCPAAREQP